MPDSILRAFQAVSHLTLQKLLTNEETKTQEGKWRFYSGSLTQKLMVFNTTPAILQEKYKKNKNKGWITKDKIWNNEAKIIPSGTNRFLKLNLVM